jgi:hypothetical protein
MEAVLKSRKVAPPSPATVETPSPEAKRTPVATLREGDCSASIWTRQFQVRGTPRVFYSVTLERSYKDRNGAWKYTRSFDAESLGTVASLCRQAEEAIIGLSQYPTAR